MALQGLRYFTNNLFSGSAYHFNKKKTCTYSHILYQVWTFWLLPHVVLFFSFRKHKRRYFEECSYHLNLSLKDRKCTVWLTSQVLRVWKVMRVSKWWQTVICVGELSINGYIFGINEIFWGRILGKLHNSTVLWAPVWYSLKYLQTIYSPSFFPNEHL